ncbi:hypothetical protein CKAH01_17877 [Colletotrichum kahawae]|uniref:Uncharacterized protein n=1 Tax=Colletotrichum kahawae TaxID=34407 RepID=A0AAD9YAE5_COLKA|nr:hypothetical protein CKAH01_17877 [Colletotrichum kahawae]
MAHRAAMGWQVNLRTHEIVLDFSQDLIQFIQADKPSEVYQYLEENRISPFVLDRRAYNLLHASQNFIFLGKTPIADRTTEVALRYKSLNLVKSLIGNGLGLNPRGYAASVEAQSLSLLCQYSGADLS